MAQDSSPGDSSLSEVNSPSDTYEDDAANAHGDGPPAKRQKLSTAGSDAGSLTAGPAATGSSSSAAAASLLALSAGGDKKQPVAGDKATVAAGSSHNPPDDEQAQLLLLAGDGYDDDDLLSDVSSVSSAGLPAGYTQQHYGGDDGEHQAHQQREQHVTTCAWEGCNAGDLGDMDALVSHVSSQHIDAPAADAADGKKLHTCEWLGCRSKGNPHPSASALKAHVRSHTRERPFFCFLPGRWTGESIKNASEQ